MTFRQFKSKYQKLVVFVFACLLPLAANSTTEEAIGEKRIRVAMRMIGHEVLMSMGDCESRVMPIEKIGGQYKIPFEFEFGFDPDEIVSIIDRVVRETRIATSYLVEAVQCETKEVVHSFEIGNVSGPDMVPCKGRILPEDCYYLLITILDGTSPAANLLATTSENSSINARLSDEGLLSDGLTSGSKKASPFNFSVFIVSLLTLIGLIAYFVKKKNTTDTDPNLILIGASRFDKKNMALSFEDNRVELSNKEAELLSLLHTYANAPVEREVILQRVWGDEGDYVGRTLDVFISKLRKKLEADASVKIVNIRGIGYKLLMDTPK